ncbi:hypothetical protein [Haloferula sp. BvORR071]|uniref:hypothetical protein n=1 Tax=Haloferula sp. BvORR071 TaxID=1396141 RepID=UPI000AA12ACF|nr:hypothetical protein [Haloferula sp. BvORR071]
MPLFWIGLLPVVILLGAWGDSWRYSTRWTRSRPDAYVNAQLSGSALHLSWHWVKVAADAPEGPGLGFPTSNFFGEFARRGGFRDAVKFPAFRSEGRRGDVAQGIVKYHEYRHVPLWAMLAGYLPLWAGLTWSQARRKRRRIEAMEPPTDEFREGHEQARMHTD